jgi:hypothetical protein
MGHITIPRIALFCFVAAMYDIAWAGNGKLSGRIVDVQTGQAVLGNVQIVGTALGSAADSAGRFFILDLPPGTYSIRCSAVGYQSRSVSGFVIAPENLRIIDFTLHPEDVSLEEIVVKADRMAVQSSQTSARTDFDGSEFRSLPLNSTMDLISLSPGTFKQFVGGVLPVFSRTTIDGIDVTDETALWYAEVMGVSASYDNGGRDISTAQHASFAEPNLSAIEQATLFTGTTGSDYSSAAGTLLYTLRDGRGPWGGEVSVRTSQTGGLGHLGPNVYWDADQYASVRASLTSSGYPADRQSAKFFTWFPGKYSYGSRPDVTVSLATGGSLSEALSLYVSAAYHTSADRLPNERSRQFDGSAKVTWALSPTMRVNLVGLLEDRGRLFGWKNSVYRDAYRFFLEGVPQWDGVHFTGGLKLSHFLSRATSYEVQVSVVHDNVRRGYCDDNNDGIVSPGEHGEFLTWADPAQAERYQSMNSESDFDKFFLSSYTVENESKTSLLNSRLDWRLARPPIYYENSTTRVVSLKGDLSSQVNPHHLIGLGGQLRLHTLVREMRTGTFIVGYKPYLEEEWAHHPTDLAFYLQDRMEFSAFIMNIGLRLEGGLLDAAPIADWYAPPDTVLDSRGNLTLAARRGSPLPWRWFISPRVAFSHPIGTSAAVHVSFSRTHLALPYSYLFANYDTYWFRSFYTTVPMVNIDQEPTSVLNYDIGFQWEVAPSTLFSVNAYYHEYDNLYQAKLTVYPRTPLPRFVITNALFTDARGLEISMQRDLTPLFFGISAGGRIAYAFSRLNAASPVPTNKSVYNVTLGDSAALGGRLPFDDIGMWDKSNIEILGGSSTLIAGFNRIHHMTCAFTFAFPWGIRLGGTGMFSSGFWYPEKLKADRILPYAEGPWNRRIDVRLEKQLVISDNIHVDIFVDVLNVCNWTNVLAYYDTPETAQFAWESSGDPTGGVGINRPVTREGTLIYDIPREVYFGVRLGFGN